MYDGRAKLNEKTAAVAIAVVANKTIKLVFLFMFSPFVRLLMSAQLSLLYVIITRENCQTTKKGLAVISLQFQLF